MIKVAESLKAILVEIEAYLHIAQQRIIDLKHFNLT